MNKARRGCRAKPVERPRASSLWTEHMKDSIKWPYPLSYEPVAYLKRELKSPINTIWRWQASNHGVYRTAQMSAKSGRLKSGLNFDHSITCDVCHPYKVAREGRRILEAFDGYDKGGSRYDGNTYDMYVSVVHKDHIDKAVRRARDRVTRYVALPIGMSTEYVVLTTEALFDGDGSEKTAWRVNLVMNTVMPLRWEGRLRASQGFLPPDRQHDFWEAHHPGTGRRCWHLHPSKDEAKACREDLAKRLNETTKGWRIRGVSEWRMVGRVGVTGEDLRALCDELGLLSHVGPMPSWAPPVADDAYVVEFGPVEWNDPTFVELRKLAKWQVPPNFSPPPLKVTYQIDVVEGWMTGSA
jgi:hypothetical protein